MKHILNDVKDFMEMFEQEIPEKVGFSDQSIRNLRIKLLVEEFHEYIDAEMDNDIIETADALSDMIVIILGTAIAYGIPLDKVWNEVHKSNMSKIDPKTGKVNKRSDGKVVKPEGWVSPDIKKALYG